MSFHKTQIEPSTAEHFVREHLRLPSVELKQIADGETAQAFYFETTEGSRVLRVNSKSDFGFKKDCLAYERFNSASVPIPQVFETGEIEPGLYFAVSERVPGKTLDNFSTADINGLMPDIISTLDAIHALQPIGEGYGNWDLNGKGKNSSWREMIEADLQQDDEETTSFDFYNADLAAKLRDEIRNKLGNLPEERRLIHWDYGFNNTLSDGNNITGIIDWEHSAYGDPLHDVAWLDFWADHQGFAESFKKHYAEQGQDMPRFDDRLTCYKLLIGLSSLGFFAKSRQPDKYQNAIDIVSRIKR
jgi:hygromycin-B 4-O-kinase